MDKLELIELPTIPAARRKCTEHPERAFTRNFATQLKGQLTAPAADFVTPS
ncbi:MAG: hypothetical protein KKH12_01255 [Gammaproteobacteria bacterium]|nr:hypothetical protein [Gammaproteobacteria bacterium]MBU1480279.1 hypothetical protein [Gammaproteobacteria bacterium]